MSLKNIWNLKCKFYAIFLLLQNTLHNLFQPKCDHVCMFAFLAQVRGSWNFNQKRKLVLFIGKGNFWKETIPSLDKQLKIGRFSNDFHCLKPRSKILYGKTRPLVNGWEWAIWFHQVARKETCRFVVHELKISRLAEILSLETQNFDLRRISRF